MDILQFWMYKRERKSQEVHRRSIHMDHETSPLSNTKLPKAKPIAKLKDTCLRNSLEWTPPTMN
jgi:hypothetical protein